MKFRFSRHAEWEMARRRIALVAVQAVLDGPEQHVADESGTGRWIYQARLPFEDATMYLVDEGDQPPAVVTVYRTSKIVKYWSNE